MTLADQIESDNEDVFMNQDDFAKPVKFHRHGGGRFDATALIDLDEVPAAGDGQTEYTGRIYITRAVRHELLHNGRFPLKVTFLDYDWHCHDTGNDVEGLYAINVSRQERELSGAFGLDGKQKRFPKVSPEP